MTRRAASAALAGAFVPPRDPLVDPRPWDVVEKRGISVGVHFVERGQVYCDRLRSGGGFEYVRVSLTAWREQCVGAVVIQRAEEVFDA